MEQNLTVNKVNKELYGEISTPYSFIKKMLELLPARVFRDETLRWLDPGTGHGYFSKYLYHILYRELKSKIPDDVEREKHIKEKMIYMCEINDEHAGEIRAFFGDNCNLYVGDYLSSTMPHSFDIVLGNPPFYCNGKKKTPTDTERLKKTDGTTIWSQFVRKGVRDVKKGGYLLMVTPSLWMKPDKEKTYDFMLQHKIHKLYPLTNTEMNAIFNRQAQTPSCYFLLQNIPADAAPRIDIYDKGIAAYVPFTIADQSPIPLYAISLIQKLKPWVEQYGCLKVVKTNMPGKYAVLSKGRTAKCSHANIRTAVLTNARPELVIDYSDTELAYSGAPKLVLPHKMLGFPYLDVEGEYGISNRDNYVFVGKSLQELECIQRFLSTEEALYLFEATRYRMKYLEKYIFQFLPDVSQIPVMQQGGGIRDLIEIVDAERIAIEGLYQKKYDFTYE
jgi:tRNA1(Val) A37 N6-methylase TrmN6